MTPVVSIIVPCHNSQSWLRECVNSILEQTWRDYELILVDDGSTDDTRFIVESYSDSRVKFVHQPNQGACSARNTGFFLSRGRYVQFFDSDDVMHPRKIEAQLPLLEQNPGIVVTGNWLPFVHRPGDLEMPAPPIFRDLSAKEYFEFYLTDQGDIPLSAWLLRRELVEKVGGWNVDLKRDQDGEYAARLIAASDGTAHMKDFPCYYYRKPRLSAGNVSLLNSEAKVESSIRALDTIARLAAECGVELPGTNIADHYLHLQVASYPHSEPFADLLRERISAYGGARHPPVLGGRIINTLAKLLGWKFARHLQDYYHKMAGRHDDLQLPRSH